MHPSGLPAPDAESHVPRSHDIPLDFDEIAGPARSVSASIASGPVEVPKISMPPAVVAEPPMSSVAVADLSCPVGHSLDTHELSGAQLTALLPPLASTLDSCRMFRLASVHKQSRLAVLANEGSAMGDDELNMHMRACLRLSGRSDAQYLDPLLATSWLRSGSVQHAQEWIQQFPGLQCIFTAALVQDHWMPIVWTVGLSELGQAV